MSDKTGNAKAIERLCYSLCETGRFQEAYTALEQARGKFLNAEESHDLQVALIDDYQGFREIV